MTSHVNEPRSARQQESKKVFPNRDNSRRRQTPASREEWAEVLATAERYY